MNKLSAVIPVGPNYQEYVTMRAWIKEALALNIQVIVVRDSFSEKSKRELAKVFQDMSSNGDLNFLDVAAQSPGIARNIGISIAKGEWITFWDCDDIPNPSLVMSEVITSSAEIDAIIGQFSVNGTQQSTRNLVDLAFNPGNWRIVYRREFIGEILFSDKLWGEDQLFIVETGLSRARIHITKQNFYCYRSNAPTQLTNQNENTSALAPVIQRARDFSLEKTIPDSSLLINYIMILRMVATYLKKSKGKERLKSFGFTISNSIQLLAHNKKIFSVALLEITKRIIGIK